MKKLIIKKFNLVEIVLAIGILAVGVIGIMALFPIGFSQTKDAIGENYASETAESMLAFIAREAYNNWDSVKNSIPTVKPTPSVNNTVGWTQLEGSIYDPGGVGLGIYGVKVLSGDGGDSIIDFSEEALLWRSQVKDITAAGEHIESLSYDKAMVLHLELSWPVEKPYEKRQTSTYYIELFNDD